MAKVVWVRYAAQGCQLKEGLEEGWIPKQQLIGGFHCLHLSLAEAGLAGQVFQTKAQAIE